MISLTGISSSTEKRVEHVAADFIARVSLSHDKRRTVVVLKDGSKLEVIDQLEDLVRRIEHEVQQRTGES